ncbi:primary-amine oxidase [bacterium]|nr:primary-amine oxidase [bacterium]
MKRWLVLLGLTATALAQPQHPLDPLSQSEMEAMVGILRVSGKLTESSRFPIITLHEPSKAVVRGFKAGDPIERRAFAVILDRAQNKTYEAVIDLNNRKLSRWTPLPGKQAGVLIEEFEEPPKYIRKDAAFQAAIRKRGITDMEDVQLDTWGVGLLSPADRKSGRRLIRFLAFYRPKGVNNPFYRPIEGVVVLFDPNQRKVVRVEDTGVIAPINKGPDGELDADSIAKEVGGLRPPLKPILYSQPEGSSIEVNGHEVVWENWHFRYTMHIREGLVLHDLRYNDHGKLRPVLYRGSLSEMVVPYGSNKSNWSWRNAFDLGEYGVGRLGDTLRKGYEVPKYAILQDSIFADDFGKPYVQKDSVALYEKDAGILWKHQDFNSLTDQTRPARNLYLTYVATVGNYDYALSWVLSQDGTIAAEAQLTGIMLAQGVANQQSSNGIEPAGEEQFGRLVGKQIVAPNHQHFFNFRLDMDVDGSSNSLVEINNQAAPVGPNNPLKNAFSRQITWLSREKQAGRDMNMHSCRSWMVVNRNTRNRLGQPTGYQLMPGENSVPYLHPDGPTYKRAGFLRHHLWGTQFDPGQIYTAGDYPNQSTISSGLPGWQNDNASLDNQDVVLWYTLGVTHNPRPEEWPVMPSHRTGFKLVPNGFFGRNPALDVPPPR